jgi:hypothetical protein
MTRLPRTNPSHVVGFVRVAAFGGKREPATLGLGAPSPCAAQAPPPPGDARANPRR